MQSAALSIALEAILACQRGDEESGIRRYRDALTSDGAAALPVGLHVAMLTRAGYVRAAEAIRAAGLLRGNDVSISGILRQQNPRAAISEYETLFAAGLCTATMIEHYVEALSWVGDAEAMRRTLAPETLLQRRAMAPNVAMQCAEIAEALRRSPQRQFEESRRSVRSMDRVLKTHKDKHPGLVALHAEVHAMTMNYIADVKAAQHPIARWLPAATVLRSWGVISDGSGGYNAPHTHGGVWVVAVAYIACDPAVGDDPDAPGTLKIGCANGGNASCEGWPSISILPNPGTVVIMPGFYTHWTVPVHHGGSRISVAFNVISQLAHDDPNRAIGEIAAEQSLNDDEA